MTKMANEKTQTYHLFAGMKKLPPEGLEMRQFCSFFFSGYSEGLFSVSISDKIIWTTCT